MLALGGCGRRCTVSADTMNGRTDIEVDDDPDADQIPELRTSNGRISVTTD